jgi:hypothetical protein
MPNDSPDHWAHAALLENIMYLSTINFLGLQKKPSTRKVFSCGAHRFALFCQSEFIEVPRIFKTGKISRFLD